MKGSVRILLWVLCAVMVAGMPFVVSAPNQIAEAPVEWDEGALSWLLPSACAEETQPVLPDENYALPVDFSAGMPLNPDGYTENGYQDDSITVGMETVERDGVKWRIARVQVKHPSQLRTATAGGVKSSKTALPSSMAKAKNAVVAINADYFSNDPEKTRFEFRQGEQITKNRGGKYTNNIKDVLVIDANGDFHTFITFPKETYEALMASDIQIVNAFMFGPVLVQKGELVQVSEEYGYNPTGNEPRTAIGQTGPLSYVLVIAEGRTEESEGVTQQELADFMFELGCVEAYNLDGGNSATMVFNGELYMDKDPKTERTQSDIIYFASAADAAAGQE
ncbi:MAG: phosphodiester glycosidase family protein [Clostridia bacterium]|nr:phosphodiester glycosidase family protein [Clostridia bacterium]